MPWREATCTPVYSPADRALAIAKVAKAGLEAAIMLGETFPSPVSDDVGDDLLRRLRTCVERLESEVADYEETSGRSRPGRADARPGLRLLEGGRA